MNEPRPKALVVDDEVLIRNLTMRALTREGFECDAASDGDEAVVLTECTRYDAVVTDLRMPNKNGHALAVELLGKQETPAIVVLTAVTEPRLAKDLMDRGVNDILFKPVEYPVLAAKVKALLDVPSLEPPASSSEPTTLDQDSANPEDVHPATDQPKADNRQAAGQDEQAHEESGESSQRVNVGSSGPQTATELDAIDPDQFHQNASRVQEHLPFSEDAINVYQITMSDTFDARQLGMVASRQKLLAEQLVLLANSPVYNPRRTHITDLERVAIQLGQKRIGQLSLAANMLSALIEAGEASLDLRSIWRRTLAAGFAIELLIAQGDHHGKSDGLLLCATMQEVGRGVLATFYPDHYEHARHVCQETNLSLFEFEQATFPQCQTRFMANVLQAWRVAPELCTPLLYVHESYEQISQMPEPLRAQVELVKAASLVAQIAVGDWTPWDYVEIPPPDTLENLQLLSISDVVEETRRNMDGMDEWLLRVLPGENIPARIERIGRFLTYYSAANSAFDFLSEVISSMKVKVQPCVNPLSFDSAVLANCIGVQSQGLQALADSPKSRQINVICNDSHIPFYEPFEIAATIPASYAKLQAVIGANAQPILED